MRTYFRWSKILELLYDVTMHGMNLDLLQDRLNSLHPTVRSELMTDLSSLDPILHRTLIQIQMTEDGNGEYIGEELD